MTQIRAFGQGAQIDQFKNAYNRAVGNDGRIDKNEFAKIASELNDVWKLNKIDLMGWVNDRDPKLALALQRGQAAMSANVGWNAYGGGD